MIDTLASGMYRSVMGLAAGAARVLLHLPGVPSRWPDVRERMGELDASARATAAGRPAFWVHAASVGELTAVRPLLARLRERFPGRLFVVSTLTRTGLALAREMPEVHLALLFPLDAPPIARRLLQRFQLEAFLFTETEIWPSFLAELQRRGVPAFMVSGRVSARTAEHARWLRPFYRRALAEVTCCMQTPDDVQRVVALGADARRVMQAGSVKFDAQPPPPSGEVQRVVTRLERGMGPVLIAGSTHAGEEEQVLDAYARLLATSPQLRLVLAPRHLERVPTVLGLLAERNLTTVRFSALAAEGATDALDGAMVLLLDVVGALVHCYPLGAAAFVGGSLVPVGGHNVLEPARAARPVIVGPHTEHAAEVVNRLLRAGGAVRVDSAAGLADAWRRFLAEPASATQMGQRAHAVVTEGSGAVERHVKIIAARLGAARFANATAEP